MEGSFGCSFEVDKELLAAVDAAENNYMNNRQTAEVTRVCDVICCRPENFDSINVPSVSNETITIHGARVEKSSQVEASFADISRAIARNEIRPQNEMM